MYGKVILHLYVKSEQNLFSTGLVSYGRESGLRSVEAFKAWQIFPILLLITAEHLALEGVLELLIVLAFLWNYTGSLMSLSASRAPP